MRGLKSLNFMGLEVRLGLAFGGCLFLKFIDVV